ncbi:MAG: PAAR domain-containing protein [Wolbachia endosymbiont of Andrena praecox]|uniref:PAAR domain-containing protein n=1 Tax=unclassified Wolbachia TaxID=2640676 RepID=UPI0006741377|nr:MULTISPECIES: PAAR domain-containing protein [unclassified Wolbachia]MDX5488275.1 PAAR domain-containing protein [Wolbachia endosymbiont of Andrena praecox]
MAFLPSLSICLPCNGNWYNDVFVNGRSVCRKGDILTMGETLTQGSNSVFVNDIGITRTGDLASCGFHVMSISKNVFAS